MASFEELPCDYDHSLMKHSQLRSNHAAHTRGNQSLQLQHTSHVIIHFSFCSTESVNLQLDASQCHLLAIKQHA